MNEFFLLITDFAYSLKINNPCIRCCSTLLTCLGGLFRAPAMGYRQHNREAVGGFFSQIGSLYMVHHLWGKQTP